MNQARQALMQGPTILGYDTYADFMQYKTGIYRPTGGGRPDGKHAVAAIGYGPGYFHCANSWGTRWGDRGYFKIAPGVCGMKFWTPAKMQVDRGAFPLPSGGAAPRPSPSPPPGGGGR